MSQESPSMDRETSSFAHTNLVACSNSSPTHELVHPSRRVLNIARCVVELLRNSTDSFQREIDPNERSITLPDSETRTTPSFPKTALSREQQHPNCPFWAGCFLAFIFFTYVAYISWCHHNCYYLKWKDKKDKKDSYYLFDSTFSFEKFTK